ncbi:MAG: PBP1A family penicillin-binding protein [Candidatus Binatia bacterium]
MRRVFWRTIFLIFSFLTVAAGIIGWRFYKRLELEVVTRFSNHQWEVPSKIYAEQTFLYSDADITSLGLFDLLTRLDYRPSDKTVRASGEYFYDSKAGVLQLFLHDMPVTSRLRQPRRISLTLDGDRITGLTDLDDGTDLQMVALDPELITGLYDQAWEERRVVKLYEVPSLLVKALISAEDQRFFEHEGIDVFRIIGAGWANFQAGRTTQGGSTLTQQLVKNFFLTQERTLRRKMVEACIALILEHHYSKLEILEYYLNEIYLGQRGAKGILGMWEAARFYFGKEPRDLTLSETAVLAGMVKAPNWYAPTRHPDAAFQRRNYVLQRMREQEDITQEEYEAALQESISPRQLPMDVNGAPYFADFIREELQTNYPIDALTKAGLHVSTSLDMRLQRIAQEVVNKGLEELEARHRHLQRAKPEDRLQACLIAMRPQTGEILAMVGGRDYQTSQFNRVTQAHRQPGSIFKPVVYLTALAKEREQREGRFLPTSQLLDEPFSWPFGNQVWSPGNYNDRYYGSVSLRRALEQSLNAATARLARNVGLKAIRETARRLGFVSPLPLYPSMVLGSAEATPYEVAVAFSTLANQGIRVTPKPINRVMNQDGETLERRSIHVEQVIPPDVAYMVTHLMEGVIEHGTARRARRMGFVRPAAGKTGTTNDYGDAWFAGFTPDLVAVVWVGFDHRESLKLSGGRAALPIWTEFMKHATEGQAITCFSPPPGIRIGWGVAEYEGNPTHSCPTAEEEAFYANEESYQGGSQPHFRPVPIEATTPLSPFMEDTLSQSARVITSSPSAPAVVLPSESADRKPWWRLF